MKTHKIESEEYPLLTRETLIALEHKVEDMKTTPADCYFLEHYLASIGYPGYLQSLLLDYGVTSFDDIQIFLQRKRHHYLDTRAAEITGCILACVDTLRIRVRDGEKIY